jgi:hypothetical protein
LSWLFASSRLDYYNALSNAFHLRATDLGTAGVYFRLAMQRSLSYFSLKPKNTWQIALNQCPGALNQVGILCGCIQRRFKDSFHSILSL